MEGQRVVVIEDASREVSSGAIRWALQGLSLKPGDMLTLLGVLHQVITPTTLSYKDSKKPLGYKSRVDSNSMSGTSQEIADRETARKKEEYENNVELVQISKLYESHKVELKIEIATGPSPKVVAVKTAENLKATWVILDRQMKKDRRYFLAKMSCGISRMKRNNRIEQLRGPKAMNTSKLPLYKICNSQVMYDEMVPGIPEQEELFSIELTPSKKEVDQVSQVEDLVQNNSNGEVVEVFQAEEILQNSMCRMCKNRRPSIGWEKEFTFDELDAATDSFSPTNTISEGGTGYAFRGRLDGNIRVVVKLYQTARPESEMAFKSEVNLLKKARHKNVAMFLGSCTEGSLRLLVYEYACNSTVRQHLSKHCPLPLTWMERMKVALGVARGLNYLHENNIVHGNLTTSNIVLNHDFEPMLEDFGLPIVQLDISSENKEVWGYYAPEYEEIRNVSTKTDVYAFGIFLLELITGQKPTEKMPGGKTLAGWARPLLKERRHFEIVDNRISKSHDGKQLYWIGRVIQKCLIKNPKNRLTMNKVVSALECIADRKAYQAIEDLSAVRSYLVRNSSNFSRLVSFDRRSERESFSTDKDDESRLTRSFSLTSAASISTRTSTGSTKSGNRMSLHYGEMLN